MVMLGLSVRPEAATTLFLGRNLFEHRMCQGRAAAGGPHVQAVAQIARVYVAIGTCSLHETRLQSAKKGKIAAQAFVAEKRGLGIIAA